MTKAKDFKALIAFDIVKHFNGRYFTANQLAVTLGVSYDTALNRLKALYQMGLVSFCEVEYSSRVNSYYWYEVIRDE